MKKEYILILLVWCLVSSSSMAQANYSGSSNLQFLHGKDIEDRDVRLTTFTAEHFGSYKAFEQFGFADFSYNHDVEDFEIYTEWYPKLDLSYFINGNLQWGPLSKVLLGGGINALVLNPDDFFIILGGPVWQFDVPGFNLFQLETYVYQDVDFSTSYQLTFSWDVPLPISENIILRTRGFIDDIGSYGTYARQLVAQPQLLIDIGNFWENPERLFVGIEWRYWNNFLGQKGVTESIPQLEIFYQL